MPVYYLIKAAVEKVSENADGARVTLETALNLEGVRRKVDGKHINIHPNFDPKRGIEPRSSGDHLPDLSHRLFC